MSKEEGEIVVAVHELWARKKEISNTKDCYLVGIWTDTQPEGTIDPEDDAFPRLPCAASKVDALDEARSCRNAAGWSDSPFSWDGLKGDHGRFRFGMNSPSIRHPVYLRFRWGAGAPRNSEGVQMLLHEPRYEGGEYCKHCHAQIYSVPSDCPTRRLRAVFSAPGPDHLSAMKSWHLK